MISFSNNHYYKNKLVTFPSIDGRRSRVSFKNVGGIYERGKSKQNRVEANAVVDEIFMRLKNEATSHQSIGVVTFNSIQQTLIEDLIEERLKVEPDLEIYFSDQVEEPVFVKNLENVQGDEREVILFSIGYGPDEAGKVSVNFGPLNREGGWRRLNVAVSRAKKEMVIFSSMEPDQIQLSRTKARGVHDLRAFMQFAKHGSEPLLLENQKERPPMNSEKISASIQEYLLEAGYQVERDVGVSDCKVDIAILNPKNGTYLAAILIDGVNYASEITARDRDKLKSMMLTRLGWETLNVWTIDWWHDPEKERKKLLERIKQLEENRARLKVKLEAPKKIASAPPIQDLLAAIAQPAEKQINHYVEITLNQVTMPADQFYSLEGLPIIREQIEMVVQQEAPVSFNSLTRRITEAWGFKKTGAKIRSVISNVLKQLDFHLTEEKKACLSGKTRVTSTNSSNSASQAMQRTGDLQKILHFKSI